MVNFETAIDWLSIKLNGVCIVFVVISGSQLLTVLAGAATATTIIYNIIRIYKEFKRSKKDKL